MAISINPVLPVLSAQEAGGVAPELVLQQGSVVNAQVLKVLSADLVRIAIASLSIDVGSEIPLQQGQNLQLAVTQRAFFLEKLYLTLADFCIDEIADVIAPELFDGGDAKDLEKGRIRIEDVALLICYVGALPEILRILGESLGITEAPQPQLGFLGPLVSQLWGPSDSACALPLNWSV